MTEAKSICICNFDSYCCFVSLGVCQFILQTMKGGRACFPTDLSILWIFTNLLVEECILLWVRLNIFSYDCELLKFWATFLPIICSHSLLIWHFSYNFQKPFLYGDYLLTMICVGKYFFLTLSYYFSQQIQRIFCPITFVLLLFPTNRSDRCSSVHPLENWENSYPFHFLCGSGGWETP